MCYCLLLDGVQVGTRGKVWGFGGELEEAFLLGLLGLERSF